MSAERARREVYFEFTVVGSVVKVTAIDSDTGLEVSIMGPARASQAELERIALQKLKAQLARRGQA
jgi:tRNA nucleotidyltransferase (CCA-adding enzyme)